MPFAPWRGTHRRSSRSWGGNRRRGLHRQQGNCAASRIHPQLQTIGASQREDVDRAPQAPNPSRPRAALPFTKPLLRRSNSQNPRPKPSEKRATRPRKIRDPRLTYQGASCSLKSADIVRVWKETHAHVPLTIYALALARRAGLPLKVFKCGWFDEKDYFEFYPLQGVYPSRGHKTKSMFRTLD